MLPKRMRRVAEYIATPQRVKATFVIFPQALGVRPTGRAVALRAGACADAADRRYLSAGQGGKTGRAPEGMLDGPAFPARNEDAGTGGGPGGKVGGRLPPGEGR